MSPKNVFKSPVRQIFGVEAGPAHPVRRYRLRVVSGIAHLYRYQLLWRVVGLGRKLSLAHIYCCVYPTRLGAGSCSGGMGESVKRESAGASQIELWGCYDCLVFGRGAQARVAIRGEDGNSVRK